jgi:hypothetical protein
MSEDWVPQFGVACSRTIEKCAVAMNEMLSPGILIGSVFSERQMKFYMLNRAS